MDKLYLSLQPFFNHDNFVMGFKISAAFLLAIIINVVLRSLIRVPKKIESGRNETYATIFRNIISSIIFIILANYILTLFHISIAPLLASAGIIGVVIGFGAKSLIEDLISGFFIFGQASLSIGDYVNINTVEGYVESIGLRTIAIRDETGAIHMIPNGMVKQISNYSRGKAHVYIDVMFKSDQKIDTVVDVMEDALKNLRESKTIGSYVHPESSIMGIEILKEGSLMGVRADIVTHTTMRWRVGKEFRYLVKKACEKKKVILA